MQPAPQQPLDLIADIIGGMMGESLPSILSQAPPSKSLFHKGWKGEPLKEDTSTSATTEAESTPEAVPTPPVRPEEQFSSSSQTLPPSQPTPEVTDPVGLIPQEMEDEDSTGEQELDQIPEETVQVASEDYRRYGTKSKSFKSWFGDWETDPSNASKVVYPDTGKPRENYGVVPRPLRVYHGTPTEFSSFSKAKSKEGVIGKGFYFAEDRRVADVFASEGNKIVLEVFLNIRRPFDFIAYYSKEEAYRILEAAGGFGEDLPSGRASYPGWAIHMSLPTDEEENITTVSFTNLLASLGYDGVTYLSNEERGGIYSGPVSEASYGRIWVSFEPDQIKAIQNRGTFSPSSRNMYKQIRPSPFGPVFVKSGPRNLKVRAEKPQTPYGAASKPKRSKPSGAIIPNTQTPPPRPPRDQGRILGQIEKEAQRYRGRGQGTELGHWIRARSVLTPVLQQFEAAGVQNLDVLAALLNHEKVPENAVNLTQFHDDESPFVILSQPGQTLVQGGAPAVVVGPPYIGMVHHLEVAFPSVNFVKVEEAPNELKRAAIAPEKPIRKSLLPTPFGMKFIKEGESEPKEGPRPTSETSPSGPISPVVREADWRTAPPEVQARRPDPTSNERVPPLEVLSQTEGEPRQPDPSTATPSGVQDGFGSFTLPILRNLSDRDGYIRYALSNYVSTPGASPEMVQEVVRAAGERWDYGKLEAEKYRKNPLKEDQHIRDRIDYYSKGPSEKIVSGLWKMDQATSSQLEELRKRKDEAGNRYFELSLEKSTSQDEQQASAKEYYQALDEFELYENSVKEDARALLANSINAKARWRSLVSLSFGKLEGSDPEQTPEQRLKEVTGRTKEAFEFLRSIVSYGDMGPKERDVRIGPIPKGGLSRPHYNRGSGVHILQSSSVATIIHEFGHYMENMIPGVRKACQEFLAYRTEGDKLQKLQTIYPISGYGDDEFGYEDRWKELYAAPHYIGKQYESGDTEILSMGLQLLYENPVHFAKKDPEYFRFVLGVLDGSLRKY